MAEYAEAVGALYQEITGLLIKQNITAATMESCTAGLIASLLTDVPGASAVFLGGSVTYCNREKVRMGVAEEILEEHGVYSAQTALAMARACRENTGAELGIGITGVFGNPDPANPEGLPGQIYFAIDRAGKAEAYHKSLPAQKDRPGYKLAAAEAVGKALLETL